MGKIKVITALLYASSNWLLKFSFLALPLALFLSMSAHLFIDNLLKSYESHLTSAYLGLQGRLSIRAEDPALINALMSFSQSEHLTFSVKREIKTNLVFMGDTPIAKHAKFVILGTSYLKQKFSAPHAKTNTFFVNDIFFNSMGSLDLGQFKQFYFDDEEKVFTIDQIIRVDTGFVSSEPIIFLSDNFAKDIFHDLRNNASVIEFLEQDKEVIQMLKQHAMDLAIKHKTMEYQIHDLIEDTKEIKSFFKNVSMIQSVISLLIFLISTGVIVLGVSIFIEFKKSSLKTLQLIGMSRHDLAFTISGIVLFLSCFMVFLALCIQPVYQNLFLDISNFNATFFDPLKLSDGNFLLLLALMLSTVVFITTNYIFKGNQ